MKFTWTPEDISCGRVICKNIDKEFEPCGWTAKHTYKIGWLAAGNPAREYSDKMKGMTLSERQKYIEENRADYCLVCLTDGMICNPMTKQEMCDSLNKTDMGPMPNDWLIKTMEYLRRVNENGNG